MTNNDSKGLKPFILKVVIIMMGLLYILGPVHQEVNSLLHSIVHTLEMPDTLLSHQNESNAFKNHTSDEHKNSVVQHDHKVINIIESILEGANNGNESPDSLTKSYKHDKHIKIRESFQNKNTLISSMKMQHYFIEKENNLCKGYPKRHKEPPQIEYRIILEQST